MDTIDCWPIAREYSIWNAAVAALQFWTVDLKAHMLSSAIEQVYNAFCYSTSMHLLCQQSDEIIFSCFMTTLNAAFESKLALDDEGYECGSENFNIPTPHRWTSKIHHVSNVKNTSFDPDPVMSCRSNSRESHHRLVCRCLTFSSSEEDDDVIPADVTPPSDNTPPKQHHIDTFQQPPSKCILNMYVTLEVGEEEEEEDYICIYLANSTTFVWDLQLCKLCIMLN